MPTLAKRALPFVLLFFVLFGFNASCFSQDARDSFINDGDYCWVIGHKEGAPIANLSDKIALLLHITKKGTSGDEIEIVGLTSSTHTGGSFPEYDGFTVLNGNAPWDGTVSEAPDNKGHYRAVFTASELGDLEITLYPLKDRKHNHLLLVKYDHENCGCQPDTASNERVLNTSNNPSGGVNNVFYYE